MQLSNIYIPRTKHERISSRCLQEMAVLRYISLLQLILILLYIMLPLFELFTIEEGSLKPYPYNMKFPYDANRPGTYAITYFLTSLAGFGVVTNLFSEDSLFAFFTTYTCGRLRVIQEDISKIMHRGQMAYKKISDPNKHTSYKIYSLMVQREYMSQLIKIIKDHNTVIRLVKCYLIKKTIMLQCYSRI